MVMKMQNCEWHQSQTMVFYVHVSDLVWDDQGGPDHPFLGL